MHFTSFIIALATGAGFVSAALPKANEYKSHDCSGDLNFGHHAFDLHEVTMDDSSNSVYQAGVRWHLFEGKQSDGGHCEGNYLGQLTPDAPACLDLDHTAGVNQRVRCLCNPLIGVGRNGGGNCGIS